MWQSKTDAPSVTHSGPALAWAAGLRKLVALALMGTWACAGSGWARTGNPVADIGAVTLSALPPQGAEVYARIHQGGPFVSEKDGTVFGNRERMLPPFRRGYYLEYTVPTPGLSHRGQRRIVCGGARTQPDICYYTADHYQSFRRIVP
jgi:ribonuclease T1